MATMVDLRRSHIPHSRPIPMNSRPTFAQDHWRSAEAMAAYSQVSAMTNTSCECKLSMCACRGNSTTRTNSFGISPPQQSTMISMERAQGVGRPVSGHWRLDIGGGRRRPSVSSIKMKSGPYFLTRAKQGSFTRCAISRVIFGIRNSSFQMAVR